MEGKLYIVATPIGNLDDITYRAVEVLQSVDIIAAEDTRHTLKLLNHLGISKPLISYYKEIERGKAKVIIDDLKKGKNIAVVSDAGTPGISDPGEEVIKEAIENGIAVVPIPGACAAINSLICSGMSTKEFTFIGFLPAKINEKKKKLEEIKNITNTLIFYEAPHKVENTLKAMMDILCGIIFKGQNSVFGGVFMKISTGIIRRVDELGRIVIPKEMRKELDIDQKDPIEISIEGQTIVLKKYENRCVFCGALKPAIRYNGKLICTKCLKEINKSLEK